MTNITTNVREMADFKATFALYSGGDNYGTAMGFWFAVAATLWDRGAHVPQEWEYRPSPMGALEGSHEEAEIAHMSNDALLACGHLLSRYIDMLKRHGAGY